MSGDENDEDLKRAIALSLQESPENEKKSIIEISDDEDDDLDAPLTARAVPTDSMISKPDQSKTAQTSGLIPQTTEDIPPTDTPASCTETLSVRPAPPGSVFLGLDRKLMEQERLARLKASKSGEGHTGAELNKRKAEIAFRDHPKTRNVKARTPANEAVSKALPVDHRAAPPPLNHSPVSADNLQYPDGVVKKTWVMGYDRDGSDIKIEEVLQKDTLELAVLSAFQIDAGWISSKLHDKTKVIWVLQAKSQAEVGYRILPMDKY